MAALFYTNAIKIFATKGKKKKNSLKRTKEKHVCQDMNKRVM